MKDATQRKKVSFIAPPGSESTFFCLSSLFLVCLAIAPIWSNRFLPMQDYPQHLFIANVLATYGEPGYDWKEFYQVTYLPGPYSLFYLILRALSGIFSIENAGKIYLTLYLLLTSVVVLRAGESRSGRPRWGVLLLFPLAFHQLYFLGFTNFLIAVPILFLALLDLEAFISAPLSHRTVLGHSFYQLLLFVSHPFIVAAYLVLAFARAVFSMRDRQKFIKAAAAPAPLAIVLCLWYFGSYGSGYASGTEMVWARPAYVSKFFILMFTGMNWTNGPNIPMTVAWAGIGTLFLINGVRDRDLTVSPQTALFFVLSLAGLYVLPFVFSVYSYFNVRMAPISYVFLALMLSGISLTRLSRYVLVSLISAVLVLNMGLHRKISEETESILPVIDRMEKNATVLPLAFDASSAWIDSKIFYGLHQHDPFYYHLLAGGGFNPRLFPNPMMPVQYLPAAFDRYTIPASEDADDVADEAAAYKYLLARGPSPEFIESMLSRKYSAFFSGRWVLFSKSGATKNPMEAHLITGDMR